MNWIVQRNLKNEREKIGCLFLSQSIWTCIEVLRNFSGSYFGNYKLSEINGTTLLNRNKNEFTELCVTCWKALCISSGGRFIWKFAKERFGWKFQKVFNGLKEFVWFRMIFCFGISLIKLNVNRHLNQFSLN